MKQSILIFGLFAAVLVFQPAIARGQSLTPVGSWEITILGVDRGNEMLTFSNDFTVSGYGITRKESGLFTLTGNWGFDSHGDVVVASLQSFGGTNTAASLTAHLTSATRFVAKGKGTAHRFRYQGEKATDFPDLSGFWTAEVSRLGKTLAETYTISPATNFPAVFDVTGQGLSDTGSYTLSGVMIATSHDKLTVSIDRTFPGPDTVHSSLSGTFKHGKPTMVLHGSDQTDAPLKIKAIQ